MKVLWPIDPFDISKPLLRSLGRIAAQLRATGGEVTIEPAFVSVLKGFDRDCLRAAMKESLEHCAVAPLLPPRIVPVATPGLRNAVDALARYAKTSRSDLIIVATHSRRGLDRLFLGSFAEALLLRTEVPVLAVNPHSHPIHPFKQFVFPTDFGRGSLRTFTKVLELASRFGARVTVYHMICPPLRPFTGLDVLIPGSYWRKSRDYLAREESRSQEIARRWQKRADAAGVKLSWVIERGEGELFQRVVSLARRRHAGSILLRPQRGPAATAVLGSATRRMLRNSTCPIWVMRHRPAA